MKCDNELIPIITFSSKEKKAVVWTLTIWESIIEGRCQEILNQRLPTLVNLEFPMHNWLGTFWRLLCKLDLPPRTILDYLSNQSLLSGFLCADKSGFTTLLSFLGQLPRYVLKIMINLRKNWELREYYVKTNEFCNDFSAFSC